jgi:hypothetical protein
MSERLRLMGLLEEKRAEAVKLRLRIEGLRDGIRNNLPRHEPIDLINGDLVANEAVELAANLYVYRDLVDEIGAIKRDIGA